LTKIGDFSLTQNGQINLTLTLGEEGLGKLLLTIGKISIHNNPFFLEKIKPIEEKIPNFWDDITCKIDPHIVKIQHLQLMISKDFIENICKYFFYRKWIFFINMGGDLYWTSDNPIIKYLIYPPKTTTYGDGGLMAEHIGIFFPISSHILINMLWNRDPVLFPTTSNAEDLGYERADLEFIKIVNNKQVENSLRFLYAGNDIFDEAKSMCEKYPEIKKKREQLDFH
jgi:hypothetical protein